MLTNIEMYNLTSYRYQPLVDLCNVIDSHNIYIKLGYEGLPSQPTDCC